VPVAAGVLTDATGRILLARRTAGRDMAGAWEFPGGKIERHESSEQALKRELKEELGIEVLATEPLMSVPQNTGDKSIKLDVFKVTKYSGQPRGLENQALAWVPTNKLRSYPMPSADLPVVAALQGAVVGGGLELAASCHIRVADDTTFYALPEGTRGIFVGGGGAVRIPKLIGVARMTDMMMTGRVYNAVDGERIGFAQYLVAAGTAFDKALELAQRIATNAPLTNYALMHALPRIAEQTADHGFVTESLMSSITQAAPEAKARVEAFLQGRAAKVENK
jgi:mutator protein MutT